MTDERFIITHEDGRTYSVTRAVFTELYEAQGFTIVHEESAGDFLVDVPRPRRHRSRARRRGLAPAPFAPETGGAPEADA